MNNKKTATSPEVCSIESIGNKQKKKLSVKLEWNKKEKRNFTVSLQHHNYMKGKSGHHVRRASCQHLSSSFSLPGF